MDIPFLSISGFSKLPIIRQSTASECGIACLAMISAYYGNASNMSELRRLFPISLRGITLKELMSIAGEIQLSTRAIRLEISDLNKLRLPCILHWDFKHFVVLSKVSENSIRIHDPARGYLAVSLEDASRSFTGVALEVTPAKEFKKKRSDPGLKLGQLLQFDKNFFSSFSAGFILSLIGEILLLTTPFYLQVVIDEVLIKGDKSLLNTVAIAFGIILVFQASSNVLRQLTFQFLSQIISFQISARVVKRLLNLPISYFQSRELGDIQHRVQSIQQIQDFISRVAPKLILDGIFSVLIITLMFMYSAILSGLVLFSVVLYIAFRIFTYGLVLRAAGDLIVAEANNQTELLETLRAIPTLKMMAIEPLRESKWNNSVAKKLNAYIRTGNLEILNTSVSLIIFQGLRVILVFLAANMVLNGGLTVGMISAFTSYYLMFTGRIEAMIEGAIQLKLLSVPLSRLSDIVFSDTEDFGEDGGRNKQLYGAVSIAQGVFRYGKGDDLVLKGLNIHADPGEFVAIVGPSGSGKTTSLKIIAGLHTLDSGELLFDKRLLRSWDLRTIRQQVGMVLQEDTLLRGSIAENIALFDEHIDMDAVREAATLANISSEIESFPMGYETLVGDMGSSLSGGQKQRVLLARALYRRPQILLLDEATSHLDLDNELAIQSALDTMKMTRIVVAHRPQTIENADKVYLVENGRAKDISKEIQMRRAKNG